MMPNSEEVTIKKNVSQFDKDVQQTGSYAYTAERLSASIANARFSECIASSYDFKNKTVLDLGCGDGTYTLEYAKLGVAKVVGVDPASAAIEVANAKAKKLGVDTTVTFEVGNIYALEDYLADNKFDCIALRGVLHHLPDPERAIAGLAAFKGTIIVLEPNGNNPVLKLLEKYSRYHVEHEERSFSPKLIHAWFTAAGFTIKSSKVFNLVPMFCPDWMAKLLLVAGPLVEHIPLLRDIACGQSLIVAKK
jgi:2-polyprenyl-3-methyl-5-hydroxy-6-metoxy-1,4-benzoquinol methylase